MFLGDIPFDMATSEIEELVATVGPVVSFKLVYNPETKKSRGFGFIEYRDIETAKRAVQHFNNMPLRGRRLKADYSGGSGGGGNRDREDDRRNGYQQHNSSRDHQNRRGYGQQHESASSSIPEPSGLKEEVPPNVIVNDNISRTLAHLPPPRLLELINTLKMLVFQDANAAHDYFKKNMEVTYSVVQAMLLMGLVDARVVTEAASNGVTAVPPPAAPAPTMQNNYNSMPDYNSRGNPRAYEASPPPPPPPPQSDPLAGVDPQQAALIKQVLELTDEQINYLGQDEKATILKLREQYRRGVFS